MKLKDTFVTQEMDGEQVMVEADGGFAGMVRSNATAAFIIDQGSENVREEILIALFSLVACSAQFLLGKVIGQRYNARIAGGQALGQKNTVLAIWMALTYVHPIASIGPASYVVWQNIINSWQLWKKNKRDRVKAQQEQ